MAFPYPYIGPIALFNNLPIEPQFYQPRQYFISAITLGANTTVTTSVDHDYVVGNVCRLIIPYLNGCRQLNEVQGDVISIPAANQVILNINSAMNVDPFKTSTAHNQPQILAIGDVNTGAINANGNKDTSTSIPGAFINISPE